MKQFWKKVCTWCLLAAIAICVLSSTGCMTVPTNHTQKQTYQAGEIIRIYDNESEARLATVVITNVRILRDEPYSSREYLGPADRVEEYKSLYSEEELSIVGTKVYKRVEYAAVVQIDYQAETLDSSKRIDEDNFSVEDCNGKSAEYSVEAEHSLLPTDDEIIVVGIKEKGDVHIRFRTDSFESSICEIICEYDEKTNSYIIVEDPTAEPRCTACGRELDYDDAYCKYCGQKQE